jgi:hypothetical protein
VSRGEALLLWQRPLESRRLAGFWDLPESTQLENAVPGAVLGEFRHSITNTDYRLTVMAASVRRKPRGFTWVEQLANLPLTTIARKALRFRPDLKN